MIDNQRLASHVLRNLVRSALAEDVGGGDATTLAVIPEELETSGNIATRQDCVIAGMPVAEMVFTELDPRVVVENLVSDGTHCRAGATLAVLSGPARALLTGERTALNFIQRLSGIATATAAFVDALGDSPTRLLDTRKTTPGLRALEKYAVTAGGGDNHRFGLFDMIMIKDNHCQIAELGGPGAIARAVANCRELYPGLKIEVETDTLDQVRAALDAKVDFILLDNMTNAELAVAVALRNEVHLQAMLEASGGITLDRVLSMADLGLDYISVGAITHSAGSIDIGLDFDVEVSYP
ncbi:MAG: carboxylating nicotinate-nucleotide diphosphorylase [Lentisphaeria bacterium]|jgi:nicotinate-nucleotide pyrophosphorylase (carboxylating)|nr:carboxylating nicotinate-nucleotide diphosphorylase [Lentisphaeria bacterium]MDP7743097.1 carboxylating nicotinate-nucleotide diphosphorylase [Lentisphaeria bacterium]